MLYYSFFFLNFPWFYSLHFVSHNLFGGRYKKKKKKTRCCIYESNGILGKINQSYKFLRNKLNTKISYFKDFLLDSKSNQI